MYIKQNLSPSQYTIFNFMHQLSFFSCILTIIAVHATHNAHYYRYYGYEDQLEKHKGTQTHFFFWWRLYNISTV